MKHRIARLGLLAAAVLALSGVAYAQNLPAQFVVSGKAAEKIQDYTTINLATAQRIAETCERLVTAHGGGQHSIIFLDNDGNHVYHDRHGWPGLYQRRDAGDEGPHRAPDARAEPPHTEYCGPESGDGSL